jgi:hypothetical protein
MDGTNLGKSPIVASVSTPETANLGSQIERKESTETARVPLHEAAIFDAIFRPAAAVMKAAFLAKLLTDCAGSSKDESMKRAGQRYAQLEHDEKDEQRKLFSGRQEFAVEFRHAYNTAREQGLWVRQWEGPLDDAAAVHAHATPMKRSVEVLDEADRARRQRVIGQAKEANAENVIELE